MLNFAVPCNFNVFEMVHYLGQERWAAPWGRGQLGGWDAFLDHLQYFGYLLPVLTVVIGRRAGLRNVRTLICVGMSVVMALFLAQSGSRRVIGVVAGMALILWVLDQRRLRIKHLLTTVFAIVALLVALAGDARIPKRWFRCARWPGRSSQWPLREKTDSRRATPARRRQFLSSVPDHSTHSGLLSVRLSQVSGLRDCAAGAARLLAGKPVDPGFDLPTALGVQGVSFSYSVIGELYMSLGFIGIALGGWFYGRVASTASGLLARCTTQGALVIYSIVVMALFSGMRSILELILVSYVVLAWVGFRICLLN